ncbi:MAG: hypothetical protein O6916_00175 [bacterium]|nr:hypothetical protein [bacterium]MCZ6700721.1 hypothetical protein [bacterium]
MLQRSFRDEAIRVRILPSINPDDDPPRPGAVEFAEEDVPSTLDHIVAAVAG